MEARGISHVPYVCSRNPLLLYVEAGSAHHPLRALCSSHSVPPRWVGWNWPPHHGVTGWPPESGSYTQTYIFLLLRRLWNIAFQIFIHEDVLWSNIVLKDGKRPKCLAWATAAMVAVIDGISVSYVEMHVITLNERGATLNSDLTAVL